MFRYWNRKAPDPHSDKLPWPVSDCSRSILCADHIFENLGRLIDPYALHHFGFRIPDHFCLISSRTFHRNNTHQLQQVILDHIPQSSAAVIVTTPFPNPYFFCNTNLDMIDILIIPQGFKNIIGETKGKNILHGLLSQVMINSVNLTFP